jgi:predicted MFS family arabinose efflux permease
LSPMIQEEGVSPLFAAWAVSAFAVGQLLGRVASGWWLDRGNPRLVAFFFTFFPASGFVILFLLYGSPWLALVAAAIIGVQQGSETDMIAYIVSRRFGMANYATIYGWIIAFGWIGNAAGVVGFGWLHDATGGYGVAQALGAAFFIAAALLIYQVRLEPPPSDA